MVEINVIGMKSCIIDIMGRDLSDYQAQYAAQPYEKYQAYFRCREVKNILARHPRATILETGCGLESIFLHLDSFAKIIVVEPAADFFKKAQQDAISMGDKNIVIVNTTLEDVPQHIKNHEFDFILVSSLLHEIFAPKAFLATLYNLCGADTIVHINVPNAKSFHRRLAVEMGLIKNVYEVSAANVKFQQHTVFDADSLHRMVEDAGFFVCESGAYAFKPFTHEQMQKMIDCRLLTHEMADGLYAMGKYLPDFCSEIYVNLKKQNARF